MWTAITNPVDSGLRLRFCDGDEPLPFSDFFRLLDESADFATWYSAALTDHGSQAFFWEHPALTTDRLDNDAECVLIDSRALAGLRPDPAPFARYFSESADRDVVTFKNLGGDALLVAPCPIGPHAAYPHLARFLRDGPGPQRVAFWSAVSRAVTRRVSDVPMWLSTSGLGVAWLHVRLDSRPKYYQHAPYLVNPAADSLE